MKKKLVLWGNDAEDKKILIGIELIDEQNAVKIYTYNEQAATQLVYDTMMSKWREDDVTPLPEGYQEQERPLSVSDDLLPEDIKVERTDLISRAKAEWHFIVLSSKLYQMYNSELEDFKDKVEDLGEYSEATWEEMKTFWTKVQEQVRDKNLFREHAGELRQKTNALFEKLKSLKKSFQSELKKSSAETAAKYKTELEEIEAKLEKGLGLKPLFDQLKDVQARFKKEQFTRDDQRKLWNKIDAAFKVVKEKRFGDKDKKGNQAGGAVSRVQQRLQGLHGAIDKMQRSIDRDNKDLEWENKRIEQTDGQLEMQIRQAKIIMIKERISSKQVKMDDMLKTRTDLEKKVEVEKRKDEERAAKQKSKEVQNELKQKIASEIAEAKEARSDDAEKLKKLAAEVAGKAAVTPVVAPAAIADVATNVSVDPVDIAPGDVQAAPSKPIKETPVIEQKDMPAATTKVEDPAEESIIEEASAQISSAVDNAVDTVKAVAEVVEDKIENAVDQVKDRIAELKDDPATQEKIKDIKEEVSGMMSGAISAIKGIADKVEDIVDKVEDKVEQVVDDITGEEE